jgi:hypothetical protein
VCYADCTCWEIYARDWNLIQRVRLHAAGRPWVEVYDSHAERRGEAFCAAGLSQVWAAMNPSRA